MLKVKADVRPRSLFIFAAAANLMVQFAVDCVATSANDGTHMPGSAHYEGRALDLRSKTFPSPESKRTFMTALQAKLGPGYQVQLHFEGEEREHFHVEYQPRGE